MAKVIGNIIHIMKKQRNENNFLPIRLIEQMMQNFYAKC